MRSQLSGHDRSSAAIVFIVLVLCAGLVACQATRQRRSAEPRGFLGDYSEMRKGSGLEGQLIYINPRADFTRYNAVILDSVTLWHTA